MIENAKIIIEYDNNSAFHGCNIRTVKERT